MILKTDFNFQLSNNAILENDNQNKVCHFAGFRYINHLENKNLRNGCKIN